MIWDGCSPGGVMQSGGMPDMLSLSASLATMPNEKSH
jgi:hypothetical protein